MKKRGIAVGIGVGLLLSVLSAGLAHDFRTDSGQPPAPRLLSPVSDEIILTGRDSLEFKWQNTDYFQTQGFDFRLYKGYGMLGANLVFKQRLGAGEGSIKIKAELFDDGQVYTWSLMRIALGGEKSERSYQSFKIIRE